MNGKFAKNKVMISVILAIFGSSLMLFGFTSVITNAAPTETSVSAGIDVLSISFSNIRVTEEDQPINDLAQEDAFSIQSVSFSAERRLEVISSSGSARTSGSVILNDIVVTKFMDSSSPILQQAIAEGTIFDEVKITHWVSTSGESALIKFFEITLENVIISSYNFVSNGEDIPTEQVALNFDKVKIDYFDPDGTKKKTEFIWDLVSDSKP